MKNYSKYQQVMEMLLASDPTLVNNKTEFARLVIEKGEADRSVEAMRKLVRAFVNDMDSVLGNENESVNEIKEVEEIPAHVESDLAQHLKFLGIDESEVKSVKYWQTMTGENRFSVVRTLEKESGLTAENILDNLRKTLVDTYEPIRLNKIDLVQPKAFFAYTSDKHAGASVSGKSVFKNHYTASVLEDRMMGLLDEIFYRYTQFGRFDQVTILDLGDSLDGHNGQTTRGGHRLPQNEDSRGQFDTLVGTHRRFFDKLVEMDVTNSIEYRAVTDDNHAGAFGYCAQRAVQIYLEVRYPDIVTEIYDKFVDHFTYGEHCFIVTHGKDEEDMKHGFPLKLNDKVENWINSYIEYNNINSKYIHFVKGDLHQSLTEYGKRFRYKNVMSVFGSSKWIHTNFGPGKAGVDYEIVEKNTRRILQDQIIF